MPVLDTTDIHNVWGYSHGDSPDVHQTLANAANSAGQANGKLDQVLQLLNRPVPPAPAPVVDVNALSAALLQPLEAALIPHVTGGVDAAQLAQLLAEPVAHAVVMHFGSDLQAG